MTPIAEHELEDIDAAVARATTRVDMQPGDVVLLDTYQVLHGREPFEGERQHGVMWLTSPRFSKDSEAGDDPGGRATQSAAEGILSGLVNRLAVKR